MAKFRKKPVEVEAVQWSGSNWHQILDFAGRENVATSGATLIVHTLEGVLHASAEDWIVKGIKGEFYPVKPDIFEATYDKVEDE